ncbi:MAG: recombination mediator RecR [Planctomycetes bacterium]|nr:recombination mediator RecR [Planctomycetota bacterium]
MTDHSMAYSASVRRLLDLFGKLPGVGSRSAERMVFHILKGSTDEAMALADAIRAVKEHVRHCRVCYHLTEVDPCEICRNPSRDAGVICVVEQSKDLFQIEATGTYRGVYHVLLGHLAALDGITPENLTIDALVKRVNERDAAGNPLVREVIIATNPTMDGDGTALYIQNRLEASGVNITRLARGLPAGAQIEQANKAILADALAGRVKM